MVGSSNRDKGSVVDMQSAAAAAMTTTLKPTNSSGDEADEESGDYDVNTPFIIGIWVLSASIAKIGM